MSSSLKALSVALALVTGLASAQAPKFEGIGRSATQPEIKAWDIDVRPDFKGLPPGRGTVAQGQELWEAKCAGCHGVFGESNEVFSPLIGGTTKEDIKTGRVASLRDNSFPGRTTMMKVSQLSSLWDYINRAMPWTAPKSLKPDEVYAVTAYMLSLADVLPADGELSDKNIAEVQQRLPNRNGKSTRHALWPGAEFAAGAKPDVQGSACVKNCAPEAKVASYLPDFARDAHGNLAQQQRLVGPQRGIDTQPKAPPVQAAAAKPVSALLQQHACMACHQIDSKVVGPSFREVVAKYKDRSDAREYYAAKLKSGSAGIWGAVPMPPQTLPEADLATIAAWLAAGARP
ncbi:c-type cytochrome [Paucibacter sp. XJ19-41]|uniref:c-type cytochrome n=1 Tax=Paucibacter sp. XJ19-41 TaxID=2927824 RepID=UPI00234A2B6C|nr:c-type cytochrome [Paucibacter sp. XJ19-41]MDC6167111.1 c-type cytochrome [Paucibacter sp. XJ19-41]